MALLLAAHLLSGATPAAAQQAASCSGAAMLGGTELVCSHTIATAPTEFCTFSWALVSNAGTTSVVEGSFMLLPGTSNLVVYQSGAFSSALSEPIVLCQGRAEREMKPR